MFKSLVAIIFALAAVGAARANLITNGSFETTSTPVPAGSYNLYSPGATGLTGWTVVGPAGSDVADVSASYTHDGVTFPAEDGSYWLDLTGLSSNTTEGVAQTIATTV